MARVVMRACAGAACDAALYNDAASYVCRRNETARYVLLLDRRVCTLPHEPRWAVGTCAHTQEQLAQLATLPCYDAAGYLCCLHGAWRHAGSAGAACDASLQSYGQPCVPLWLNDEGARSSGCSLWAAGVRVHTRERWRSCAAAPLRRCSQLCASCLHGVWGHAGGAEQLVMLLSKDTASYACLCSSKTSTEQWAQLVLPLLCNDAASYVLSAWHMVSCGHIYRSSL